MNDGKAHGDVVIFNTRTRQITQEVEGDGNSAAWSDFKNASVRVCHDTVFALTQQDGKNLLLEYKKGGRLFTSPPAV